MRKLLTLISILSFLIISVNSLFAQQQAIYSAMLMPVPQSVKSDVGRFRLSQDFSISVPEGSDKRLYDYANRILRRIDLRTNLFFIQGVISENHPQRPAFPSLTIQVNRKANLEIEEDESYQISVKTDKITLTAENDFGAMRGLETIYQLILNDETGYFLPVTEINDAPRYKWRGLMLDVATHFIPLQTLKNNLDAMAMVKLNVFHLLLSNDQGWRLESKLYPKLHTQSSDGQYYTQAQIKDLVQYANDRGIRVIPEFHLPARASSILVAYPELALDTKTQELKRSIGSYKSFLDVSNENTYVMLDKVLNEAGSLFTDRYIHIGGEEMDFDACMAKGRDFLKKNKIFTSASLQTYFVNRIVKSLKKLNKKVIYYSSLHSEYNDKKSVLVHVKSNKDELFDRAIDGFQSVYSFGYELDEMYGASYYYNNDPLNPFLPHLDQHKKVVLTTEQEKNILGAEATLMTDIISAQTIDSRVWPRMAAIAERFWSSPTLNNVLEMYKRLDRISILLEQSGVQHLMVSDLILRLMAENRDISSLKILIGTLEPYKGKLRNPDGSLYKTYSPLSQFADAAVSDAYDARMFKNAVNSYAHTRSATDKAEIDRYLRIWRENHDNFLRLSYSVPVLKLMTKQSENLQILSNVGLDALKHTESKINSAHSWYNSNCQTVLAIKKSQQSNISIPNSLYDGKCELVIIDAIYMLIDLTNPDFAKKRQHEEITGNK